MAPPAQGLPFVSGLVYLRVMRATAVLAFAVIACQTAKPRPTPPPPAPVVVEAPKPAPPELPPAAPLAPPPLGLTAALAPADNPTTPEKVELGWQLFFEPRLSKDGSMACAACHHLDKALTSGAALDAKVGGAMNKRNAPSMFNLGFHPSFYWDGRAPTLEAVSLAAWKGQLGADPDAAAKALAEVPQYEAAFQRAFGAGPTASNVTQALAAMFRSLMSGNSKWDQFMAGDTQALSAQALAGWKLFQKSTCIACHTPPLFSDLSFHHVGINDDAGRKDATKADEDFGKFKTPSLRNVALTGPYFHDGSVATLTDAVNLMAAGGGIPKGPSPKAPQLKPMKLNKKDVAALVAFLESLTGESTHPSAPTLP